MIGQYRFFQKGDLVHVSNNIITNEGRKIILRYLAGQIGKIAESIAIGIGNTAATANDSALVCEYYRQNISYIGPNFTTGELILKTTLPQDLVGQIYEVGVWSLSTNPAAREYGSRTILSFDSNSELWSGGSFVTGARVGSDRLRLSPAISATVTASLTNLVVDISGFSSGEKFMLAYNVANAFTASINIRLKTDSSNYYTYTITAPTAGYKITNFAINQLVATGTPSLSNINTIEVSATSTSGGAAQIEFDLLRIEDSDSLNPDYVLVSRSVPSVITKDNSAPMDIEYSLVDVL